jgi:hypothetical protein
MGIVTVDGIYMEDLFQWFKDSIMSSGGDGAGAIICDDPTKCEEYFFEWVGPDFAKHITSMRYHNVTLGNNSNFVSLTILYSDGNENWIFSNNAKMDLFHDDYTFVVKSCRSAKDQGKILRGAKIHDN